MKIILSRKGFDSQYGGYPSPVLPDGQLLSMPIPLDDNNYYSQLMVDGKRTNFDIMKMLYPYILLGGKKFSLTAKTTCHFDPDIRRDAKPRPQGWLGAFGQVDAAQGHLTNRNVGIGDLFLFFGWFKQAEFFKGGIRFVPKAPDLHIIFGYLEVGDILNTKTCSVPKWLRDHPHATGSYQLRSNNTIYVGKKSLTWDKSKRGFGVFSFAESLVLTKSGQRRSRWALPGIFRNATISYHTQNSWKKEYFQSAAKGQEFVVCGATGVEDWAKQLITKECM